MPQPQDPAQSNVDISAGNTASAVPSVKLYYRNQYSRNYRLDEAAVKNILKRHVFQISVKLDLIIYYKSKKTSEMIMKNNLSDTGTLVQDRSHLVYEFVCKEGECMSANIKNSYIGLTTMTLKERLGAHRYKGAIFDHYRRVHSKNPQIDVLLESTKIIYFCSDRFKLPIFEALHIRKYKPNLNENLLDFTCLKLKIY